MSKDHFGPLRLEQPHLKARGKATYYIVGSLSGKRIKYSTQTDDIKQARKILAGKAPKLIERAQSGDLDSPTFEALAEVYKRAVVDDRFIDDLVAAFGKQRVDLIRPSAVLNYAESRRSPSGKAWSAATKNRQVIAPFMAVVNYGAKLQKNKPVMVPKYQEESVTRYAPDEGWYQSVLNACTVEQQHDKRYHPAERAANLVLYMTLTGTRIGEALQLTWRDVKWDQQAISVPAAITKTTNARFVPLPAILLGSIRDLHAKRESTPNPHLIFGWRNRSGFANFFKPFCARHDVPYVPSHEFGRHAFAERLLNNGATVADVQQAGGWKTISLLITRYGHLERNRIREAVKIGENAMALSPNEHPTDRKLLENKDEALPC